MSQCPFPLVVPDDPTVATFAPTNCTIPCTGTMSSTEEIDSFNSIVTGVNIVGFVAGLFMVLTWGLFQVKEKQKITFWLSFSTLNITFSLLLGAIVSGGKSSDLWCKDNTEPITQADGGLCVFQGIWLVFFALSTNSWWFMSCFDLFSKLVLNKRSIEHYLKYYHIFSWGLPTLCTVGLAIAEQFGFFAPRVWCFLGPGSEISEWIGFYAPVTLMWITGTVLMMSVIVTLIRRIAKVEGGSSSPTKYFRYLVLYKQPLLFVLAFSFVWAIFVTFRLITLVDEQAYRDSAESWVTCLITNFFFLGKPDPARDAAVTSMLIGAPADITPPGACGVVQPGRIPKELLGLSIFVLSSASIIVFCIFGLHSENLKLWRNFICPKREEELVFDSSASRAGSTYATRTGSEYGRQFQEQRRVMRTPLSSSAESALESLHNAKSTFGDLCNRCLGICGLERDARGPDTKVRLKFEQQNNYDPRYMFSMNEQERRNKSPIVKQNVNELSYAEWESQFMVDPLWGIN